MMKPLVRILLMALPMLMSVSCKSDGEPTDVIRVYDIVCMAQSNAEGSVFTLDNPATGEPVSYVTRQRIVNENLSEGDRLLIYYQPPTAGAYTSGAIILRGYQLIINDVLKTMPMAEIAGWDSDPVYLLSAWRSGRYLNLRLRLPYDESARRFELVADAESSSLRPDLYLCHSMEADVATFDRAYYASFDIGALIDAGAEGFTLHLNNSNLQLDAITFRL